jgi:tetratricopeptide (TPR) repeat protein
MKKTVIAAAFAVSLLAPAWAADQYQIVRTESYDGANALTAIDWKDWDYFNNKNLLFPVREGMSNGREYVYKYESDAAFSNPAKMTTYLVKSVDGAPVSTTAYYSQTVYNYTSDDQLIFEFTTYANGDKEAVTYKQDSKKRTAEKSVEFTTGADKTKKSIVYLFTYAGELKQPAKMSTKDGAYLEANTYNAANAIVKKEISKDGALSSTVTYKYNELKLLSESLTSDASGQAVSREKYFYGMYKPFGEVKKNLDDWLKRYAGDGASMEVVLKKYYFTVARNPQYNEQLKNAYFTVANYYFKKEQFETAAQYYKRAISYGKSNVTGSDDIEILRRYLYTKWEINATASAGTETNCAYNVACCYSRLSRWDEALLWLDFAWQIGFTDAKLMSSDKDMQYLKLMKEDEFNQIKDRKWQPPQ